MNKVFTGNRKHLRKLKESMKITGARFRGYEEAGSESKTLSDECGQENTSSSKNSSANNK